MSSQIVTMRYGLPSAGTESATGSRSASGTYTSSTSDKSIINLGFKPKYLCIVGTHSGGQMIIYDESISDTSFRFAGSAQYAQSRNLGTSTNYNLYSIDSTGFTVNKTTTSYTYNYFAIG